MNKLISNIVKKISNQDFDIKNNYKLFRQLEKLINLPLVSKRNFEDVAFHFGDRDVRVRIFNSSHNKEIKDIIIYIHGGGWTLGSIESYTNLCDELSKETGRIVMSIDYRLAKEYPFPSGFNDCYDVVKVIMDNLNLLNIKNENICLMGDSAGGNLAAAISLRARDSDDFKISKQILFYPALQTDYSDKTKYKSVIGLGKDYLLTQTKLQDYIDLYLPDKKLRNNCYASPLDAKTLFRQPQTLIITSGLDPLRDEGKAYATRLKWSFNKVNYYNIPTAMHGFLARPLENKNKKIAIQKVKEFLGDENE